jgi:hypothetical protein
LSNYVKSIALVMALLCAASAILSFRMDGYPLVFGLSAIIFMGLNAIGAVYPLYINKGKKNPFNVYLGGMIVRLALIGFALILIIQLTSLSKGALMSLTFTAMISFVAYLAMEVRHFIRNPSGLMTAGPSPR